MCIAIHKPSGVKLLESVLRECFSRNPDGAGFCYSDEGKIVIEKGFFTVEEFLSAYSEHETKECLIHFRIKTHGDLSKEMCHPFEVNDHIAMIHNGIINGHGGGNKSDTYEFVEEIIKPALSQYGDSILNNEWFKQLVERYIGGSKLMFLNSETDEHFIYNEQNCNTADGVTFSNFSWKPVVVSNTTNLVPKWQTDYWNDFDSFPQSNKKYQQKKKSRAEVDGIKNYKGEYYYTDEFASLNWDDQRAGKKGDIILIEKCYSDLTLDIYNMSADMKVMGIDLYLLAPADEDKLKEFD